MACTPHTSTAFPPRLARPRSPRPGLRLSAPRASAPGVRRALRGGETTSGTELGRARRYPNTAGPGDSPNAGRTKGRARRSDPRVSLGGVIRIVEPFRLANDQRSAARLDANCDLEPVQPRDRLKGRQCRFVPTDSPDARRLGTRPRAACERVRLPLSAR